MRESPDLPVLEEQSLETMSDIIVDSGSSKAIEDAATGDQPIELPGPMMLEDEIDLVDEVVQAPDKSSSPLQAAKPKPPAEKKSPKVKKPSPAKPKATKTTTPLKKPLLAKSKKLTKVAESEVEKAKKGVKKTPLRTKSIRGKKEVPNKKIASPGKPVEKKIESAVEAEATVKKNEAGGISRSPFKKPLSGIVERRDSAEAKLSLEALKPATRKRKDSTSSNVSNASDSSTRSRSRHESSSSNNSESSIVAKEKTRPKARMLDSLDKVPLLSRRKGRKGRLAKTSADSGTDLPKKTLVKKKKVPALQPDRETGSTSSNEGKGSQSAKTAAPTEVKSSKSSDSSSKGSVLKKKPTKVGVSKEAQKLDKSQNERSKLQLEKESTTTTRAKGADNESIKKSASTVPVPKVKQPSAPAKQSNKPIGKSKKSEGPSAAAAGQPSPKKQRPDQVDKTKQNLKEQKQDKSDSGRETGTSQTTATPQPSKVALKKKKRKSVKTTKPTTTTADDDDDTDVEEGETTTQVMVDDEITLNIPDTGLAMVNKGGSPPKKAKIVPETERATKPKKKLNVSGKRTGRSGANTRSTKIHL